ncbi:hypothetical protein ACH5RR_026206 [Cinchona calisaya]|uniref:Uncharacterized protein n=1 Tax=Cinchona calisaya TaxID=153742 RepID=A0ABD2Z429_9GENT
MARTRQIASGKGSSSSSGFGPMRFISVEAYGKFSAFRMSHVTTTRSYLLYYIVLRRVVDIAGIISVEIHHHYSNSTPSIVYSCLIIDLCNGASVQVHAREEVLF